MEEGAINKPQEELEEIVSEEPSSREDIENETIRRVRTLDENRALGAPLLQAVMKGDWPSAEAFLQKNEDFVRLPITKDKGTALHIAVVTKRTSFVEELLKLMTPEDLVLTNKEGMTALYFAAQTGVVRIAKLMVEKNNELSLIPADNGRTPLNEAAFRGERNMVDYLFLDSVTPFKRLTTDRRVDLLLRTVSAGLYDIALKILNLDPNLATSTAVGTARIYDDMWKYLYNYEGEREQAHSYYKCATERGYALPYSATYKYVAEYEYEYVDNYVYEDERDHPPAAWGWIALRVLARKPFAIGSESQLSFWKKRLNSWHKGIYNNALIRTYAHQLVEELWKIVNRVPQKDFSRSSDAINLLAEAAKVGNVEFIIILIRSNPDLLWQVHRVYGSFFHVAIRYRQESVFNLIDEVGHVMKENITNYATEHGDNVLHCAGYCPPSGPSIAALQMQQDLLWFKKIEKIMPPSHLNMKNCENRTPTDVFKNEHKDLQVQGEKWMKQTANNCILVATVIATVVFTAAFNVPGGNDQITGKPILLKHNWFTIFFISDAIALVFSSTSILIFLSILTSRYGDDDFFKSIPLRLLFGLAALFVSIVGMVIAFSATCVLVYYSKAAWAPIVIIVLATIPITLFVLAHFQLGVDTIRSTYWSKFLFRLHKRKIF